MHTHSLAFILKVLTSTLHVCTGAKEWDMLHAAIGKLKKKKVVGIIRIVGSKSV